MPEECRLLNREAVIEPLPGPRIDGEAGNVARKVLPAGRRLITEAALETAAQRMVGP